MDTPPRRPRSPLALALALLATGCAAGSDVAAHEAAITQGWEERGDPAVVALLHRGALLCSGTLVAPGVVLTAAHCLTPIVPDEVLFGRLPGEPEDSVGVAGAHPHPGFDPTTLAHDIGVIELAYDVEVEPATISAVALDEGRIGSQARIVGFGLASAAGPTELEKRSGFSRVATVDRDTFTLSGDPSQPCRGDSGGPTFLRAGGGEPLVGVHSGGNATCTGGSVEARVDAHLPFLEPFLERAYSAPPGPAGAQCAASPSRSEGGAPPAAALLILCLARRGRAHTPTRRSDR